jgi:hypothetical protein
MNTITVVAGKDGKRTMKVELPPSATVKDLKAKYAAATKKSIHRISFRKDEGDKVVRLDDDSKLLSDYKVGADGKVTFKDLGPQIGKCTN